MNRNEGSRRRAPRSPKEVVLRASAAQLVIIPSSQNTLSNQQRRRRTGDVFYSTPWSAARAGLPHSSRLSHNSCFKEISISFRAMPIARGGTRLENVKYTLPPHFKITCSFACSRIKTEKQCSCPSRPPPTRHLHIASVLQLVPASITDVRYITQWRTRFSCIDLLHTLIHYPPTLLQETCFALHTSRL